MMGLERLGTDDVESFSFGNLIKIYGAPDQPVKLAIDLTCPNGTPWILELGEAHPLASAEEADVSEPI
jgi:hypothetical protein